MGQKVNSNIFRLGYKNNEWNSLFIEKNFEEFSLYVYKNLEIRKYIDYFFRRYFLLVNYCKIKYSNESLEIFISYYTTLKSIYLINKINQRQGILIKDKTRFFNSLKSKKNDFKKRFWIIKKVKQKTLLKTHFFLEKLLESLNSFTGNKLNIKFVLQNINKGLSFRIKNKYSKSFRKILTSLRKYSKTVFFRESINIISITNKQKKTSKLLSEFIAFQFSVMKRHNFFLNFLKRAFILMLGSNFSKLKGIKIVIKGRLNGNPRSSIRIVQIGKIPLQTFDAIIDYSQSVAFTLYGTFGIKVWICEK